MPLHLGKSLAYTGPFILLHVVSSFIAGWATFLKALAQILNSLGGVVNRATMQINLVTPGRFVQLQI